MDKSVEDIPPLSTSAESNDKPLAATNTKTLAAKVEKAPDKTKTDAEEPKPRIVLTFRSDKPGLKSSTMKIVSSEKHDDVTPRRATRAHGDTDIIDDESIESSPKKSKGAKQTAYESDETTSDTSSTTPKRFARTRNTESAETLANTIARKKKSFEPTTSPSQRLSRRIKPSAKVLANKELWMDLATLTNTRRGITSSSDKSPEEGGVKTRRSLRGKSHETQTSTENLKTTSPTETTPKKRKITEVDSPEDVESKRLNKMKKKHLSKLGLQAIDSQVKDVASENVNDESTMDSTNTESLAEHLNLQKTDLEKDVELVDSAEEQEEIEELEEDSDSDFTCQEVEVEEEDIESRPRRCSRFQNDPDAEEEDKESRPRRCTRFQQDQDIEEEEKNSRPRRCTRLQRAESESHHQESCEEKSEPLEGDEAIEATCPEKEDSAAMGTCLCEEETNIYPSTAELEEPIFCRAIDSIDGLRVGCSHAARRDADGALGPLLRAGPRAPYLMLCEGHAQRMKKHMCCSSCALFCSQGVFYQCEKGHLFHLECGVGTGPKSQGGCPHCGVLAARWWQPACRRVARVRLRMLTRHKRVVLPEQRLHCTQAYLGFSNAVVPAETGPVIPAELLPRLPVDAAKLRGRSPAAAAGAELLRLRELIDTCDEAEGLITAMMGVDVNAAIDGDTCAHLAARRGNLAALYLLQYAGASLDVIDASLRTPLMHAILALLDKSFLKKSTTPVKGEKNVESTDATKEEDSSDLDEKTELEREEPTPKVKDRLMKVIRYMVAAGCDTNLPGPDGMTALHIAAQLGGAAVCGALLAGARARVDPRDAGGWTPLVWAAEYCHQDTVRLLLAEGADAAAADGEGNAAMHWCALGGGAACLRLLLDAAPPKAADALNAHGDTPLHVAARHGHYSCVVILLARGARTDIENSAGELPVEVCSGDSQAAISLNMQLALTVRSGSPRYRLLSSDISKGREPFPIPCINEVDDAPLPEFTYVTRHVMPRLLNIDNTIATMQGCKCSGGEGCGATESAECACCALGVRRWFSRGRLAPDFPHRAPPMLFECNETCACDLRTCGNAVVTRATRAAATCARAQVFRLRGGRGWGLRALAALPRGAPVALYCGELLSLADADARSVDQYMFALDVKPDLLEQCADKTLLCVDAAQYGSAARFINHSCRANLAPVRVFTGTRDLRLPAVVLFATRNIRALEELTFDYGDKFWSVKSRTMCCECGEPDCRYPTKSEDKSDATI